MTTRLNLVGALALGLASSAVASDALAQDCVSDTDCGPGEYCDIVSSGAAGGCDPGVPECDPTPVVTVEGFCEPAPLLCTSDAECPGSLICEFDASESCTLSSADGGVESDCQTTASGTGICSYVIAECDTDSDCSGGLVCTDLPGAESCVVEAGDCDADGNCTGGEVTCTATTASVCFPEPIDCSTGQPCPASTTCVALPEDVRDDAPTGWDRDALCLPEDFTLLIEGRIGTTGVGGSEPGSVDKPAVGEVTDDAERDGAPAANPIGDLDRSAGGTASGKDGSIGCSVSGRGAGSASFGALLATALGTLLLRRRKR